MSHWQIALTVVLYLWVSIDLYLKARTGMALSFLGYAIGNLGILWALFMGQQ